MEYHVYILFSEKSLRYYVGQTQNIKERFKRHSNGFVPSTKSGLPWILVTKIKVTNRTEALKLERKIKKRGIKRFLEDNQLGVYHAKAWQDVARLSRHVWDVEAVTLEA